VPVLVLGRFHNSRPRAASYWDEAKGRRQPSWYSFRLGGWELISLSSEAAHGTDSDQLGWLRRRLREPGTCRLAFWHRPRFSAGPAHGDAPDVAPLWNSLRGRARVIVNGHEHNLQRFRRRDGLTQYVAGAGGRPGSNLPRDGRLAFGRAGVTGALRIALQPGSAVLEFRNTEGRVLDRSHVTCRRP
jgi:acid phosphatase type 7